MMGRRKSTKPLTAKQQALDRRRAAAHADQKMKMLIAAAQVFCERGSEASSMDEIAARVGLRKPRLYFHFKKKREILKACIERAIYEWRTAVAEIGDSSSGEVTLKSIVERYADVAFSDFGFCAIFAETNPLMPDEAFSLQNKRDAIEIEFKRLLAQKSRGTVGSSSNVELYWLIASSLVHGIALLKLPQADKFNALSRALGAVPAFDGEI
ncbi:MAG: TetR/AcrR family transcriptional regulator [Afipia sp.]|nr:TetR/AcrR family transcriptional regulator [Afipia sp.]